jgi:opacity protein-like surface antigen
MKKLLFFLFAFSVISIQSYAQPQAIVQEGEVGIAIGGAHYFGDLNKGVGVKNPQLTYGVLVKKQFGPYVALRVAGHHAKLGYADSMANPTKFPFQKTRNLDFQNKVWEVSVQGDFNFFKFIPGDPEHRFTPYITLGVGIIKHNPYTFLDGVKEKLQPLGTEGQLATGNAYSDQAYCFPLGMGVKYNIANNLNLGFEVVYRYTNTDYLDDVSGTYAPNDVLNTSGNGNLLSKAYRLQDRSIGQIKTNGDQRGFSQQRDQYLLAQFTLTFSFSSYKCADPR